MPEFLLGKVLHMSLIGCCSVIVVLLARFLLIKCRLERKYAYYLWLVVFVNLCIPVSIPGVFSLIPRQVMEFSLQESPAEEEFLEGAGTGLLEEAGTAPEEAADAPLNIQALPFGGTDMAAEEPQGAVEESVELGTPDMDVRTLVFHGAGMIWIAGILVLAVYNLAVLGRFTRRLSGGKRVDWKERERIAEVEGLPGPFLWGLFHPIIYLPAGMEAEEKQYILAHENCHRKRKDHLIKLLIFMVTILHWFNPLVWLAYGLCCRDMEISCDEEVLSHSRQNIRKAYAESLLKYAAKQNGYLLSPLAFGEPSVKSRIQNVLRYKKRNVVFSVMALVCVIAVAAGLLVRPAENDGDSQAKTEEPDVQNREESPVPGTTETPETAAAEVVNNGGEVIRVGGQFYYVAGQKLYSDGKHLYTSLMGESGSWAVYRYELDGSGFEKLMDGRIVGWADEWNCPYVLMTPSDTEMGIPGVPGLFLLGELNLSVVASTAEQFLGIDGEYAYFSRMEEEGLYIDRYWAGDGKRTENFIGAAVEAETLTDFHADGDYLLFAAGEVQGSGGFFYGDFYSYNRTPGRLFQEHLTDASAFAAVDGYIYYQKYSNQGDGAGGLYRASYDLTGEELVGEDLTFRAFDESTGTILAEKQPDGQTEGRRIGSLVRVNPDGSEEQTILDMTAILGERRDEEGNPVAGTHLAWNLEEGDKILFSEINFLGDIISLKAEQWGYREGAGAGWRDSLIQSVYLQVNEDGSECWLWDPERLQEERENTAYLSKRTVGEPCEPAKAGWNLEQVTDVRKTFAAMSYIPEEGTEDDTYLLGQTENYTLYGKGDYESMLLAYGDDYAWIRYPYTSNYMIPLDLMEYDYDGDGDEELAIKFNIKHGTGVYIDTFLMADCSQNDGLYVYQFVEEDFTEQLSSHLSYEQTADGLQAYVDGQAAGAPMTDERGTGDYGRVFIGSQVRFYYGDCRIFIGAELEFWKENESQAISDFNGWNIQAELSYEDGGQFTLKDFESRNVLLENTVRSALEEDYMERDTDEKDTYIRIDEIRYDREDLGKDRIEVEAVILPVGSESYDYALMELVRTSTGWKVQSIMYEK